MNTIEVQSAQTLRTPQTPTDGAQNIAAMRVLTQFRMVFGAVRSHFQRVEKAVGLGGAQVWALSVVAAQPGMGVGQMARVLNVRQPTASNMVKALQGRGLLSATRAAHDRRQLLLNITPAGQALLDQAPGPPNGVLPHALAALPDDVLQRMECDLAVLLAHLAVDPTAAHTPLADL